MFQHVNLIGPNLAIYIVFYFCVVDCANFSAHSLAFLDENAKEMVNKKGGQWSPLITYRNGLAKQDEEEEGKGRPKSILENN